MATKQKSSKKYIYVTGGKGGIGKSTMSGLIVDYASTNGTVLLIDTDPTNADSSAAYRDGKDDNVTAMRARVRAEDSSGQIDASGLIETLNTADSSSASTIVVDAPAGDSTLLMSSGEIITQACEASGMESFFVWLLDSNDRTAANALSVSWESIKKADKVILVKNRRKGTDFTFFDNNKTMEPIIASQNVQIIDLPKIAERLEQHLRIERMSWKQIASETPIGSRMEAQRIRNVMHKTFEATGI